MSRLYEALQLKDTQRRRPTLTEHVVNFKHETVDLAPMHEAERGWRMEARLGVEYWVSEEAPGCAVRAAHRNAKLTIIRGVFGEFDDDLRLAQMMANDTGNLELCRVLADIRDRMFSS